MSERTVRTESGWLCESFHIDGTPNWFSLDEEGESGWTKDASRALRFARKIDAENYISDIGWTEVFPTEHSWDL